MTYQDANQRKTWWCFGDPPKPVYITNANGGYWSGWRGASTTAV